MKCLHPRRKFIYDAYSGEKREITFPCGCCVACLHNQADSWSIRLNETAAATGYFIYDTLTLRDDALEWISYDDAYAYGIYNLPAECDHHLFGTGYKHPRPYSESIYDVKVPYLSKSVVSAWFKRGRDACRKFHHKPCKMRYFAVLEYGSKWSRPHVHLLVFDVSYADWVRFWAKPWRRDYGFTKTKQVFRTSDFVKDRNCIARYVSKYINKGSFDVPLVRAGLQPKPWRAISHGIGKEYLETPRFAWLSAPRYQYYRHIYSSWKYPRFSTMCGEYRAIEKFSVMHAPDFRLSTDQLSSLCTYSDDSGYLHGLPRYYRYKLFGSRANLLSYEVQNCILQDARERRDKKIQTFAASFECSGSCQQLAGSLGISLSLCSRIMASFELASVEKIQAQSAAKGRYYKLKNHYYRPLRYSGSNVILNC